MKKKVTDDITFLKTIKPFLPDKIASKEELTFIENNEIVETDVIVAWIMNIIFPDVVGNVKIAEKANCGPVPKTEINQAYSK